MAKFHHPPNASAVIQGLNVAFGHSQVLKNARPATRPLASATRILGALFGVAETEALERSSMPRKASHDQDLLVPQRLHGWLATCAPLSWTQQ
ncbi:uncharacterized protein BP5553_04528 [Venustampulla echinocandica]|uniref:Uncharacterized protein n=1 Tax=Venustampulla echinocandica TaxID=2656787 RepID=A0A370TNJ7_9HELO|nr:uncharacterized protein BP5553_04528 [Venustampulla echinocandica]RDL37095.1 hypothetical protein BP5553_04528 [Venustampulla echinocandica]